MTDSRLLDDGFRGESIWMPFKGIIEKGGRRIGFIRPIHGSSSALLTGLSLRDMCFLVSHKPEIQKSNAKFSHGVFAGKVMWEWPDLEDQINGEPLAVVIVGNQGGEVFVSHRMG